MAKDKALIGIAVSVIVPVYNAEKYLSECLDSLTGQTLREIEIICVNDGSTDKSQEILGWYASKDKRIKLISQQNGGAGAARNRGIRSARGEYLAFLDSDDFAEKTMLEIAYHRAVATDADICLFAIDNFVTSSGNNTPRAQALDLGYLPMKNVFAPDEISDKLFQCTSSGPTSKIFRRSFVEAERLRFAETMVAEDLFFVFQALATAKSITFVKDVLVYYRQDVQNDLMSHTDRDPEAFYKALCLTRDELRRRGLYERYERSFCEAAAIQCAFHFRTHSNETLLPARRREMLESLGLENIEAPQILEERPLTRVFSDKPAELVRRGSVEDPLISVIIPVYNTAPYLAECLDSVLAQEGPNAYFMEIICVNDGSTDDSQRVLDEYAAHYPFITLLRQENGGQAKARNEALTFAKGKYVQFIDSDDKPEPGLFKTVLEKAEAEKLDLLLFDAESFFETEELQEDYEDLYRAYYQRKGSYPGVYDGLTLLDHLCEKEDLFLTPWMFLIRRGLLEENHLRFKNGIILEDNLFDFRCFMKAKHCAYLPFIGYRYRVRENSTMTSPVTLTRVRSCYICWLEMQSEVFEYGGHLEDHYSLVYLPQAMRNGARHLFLELEAAGNAKAETAFDRLMFTSLRMYDEEHAGFEEKLTKRFGYPVTKVLLRLPRKLREFLDLCRKYGPIYLIKWLLRAPKRFLARISKRVI